MGKSEKPSLILSWRFLLAFLGFFLTAIQYMQRINMSVAIVCMINNTALKELTPSIQANSGEAFNLNTTTRSQLIEDGPFAWDKKIQGFILSSFFYGYLLTQILGAWLSLKFGSKSVLFVSLLVASILTILTPFAARYGHMTLIIFRFVIGIVHGVVWPSMSGLWPSWIPSAERSTLLGFANAGSQLGNVIALPLGGFLCIYGFDGGWPSIFYVIGIIGILWCVLWLVFVSDSPSKHRFIGEKEKNYIIRETQKAKTSSLCKIPWCKIVFSKAFLGLVSAHTCSNFGTYLFLTQLPSYMSEVLRFDIKSNGFLSAIPYLSFWLFTILSGILSDKLIQTGRVSRTLIRKIFNSLGFFVPMLAVIGLIFVTSKLAYVGVLLVTIGLAFTGLSYGSGFLVNANDIGGSYAGLVFGLSNTIGHTILVGALTPNKKQEEWQTVFLITAVVYLVGALAFIIFGQGETQKWAKPREKRIQNSEEFYPLKE